MLAIVLLLMLVPLATGCLRVRASLTISPDDQVSGEIIAAAKPKNNKDTGPGWTPTCRSARKSPSPTTTATATWGRRRSSPT